MKTQETLSVLVFILAFNVAAIAAVDHGLVAYYPFDGNADDATTNAAHGSNYTGLVTYGPGKLVQAAWFDGKSCLKLPQPRLLDGASNATISAWIYFSGDTYGQIISAGDSRGGRDPITTRISSRTADDTRFEQVVNDGQTFLGFENGDTLPGVGIGQWRLFTMLIRRLPNQSEFEAYVDGTLVKSATSTTFTNIAYDTDMPALVGALDAGGPGQFWGGGIDDLRIYNRALSKDEILSLAKQSPDHMTIHVSQVTVCWLAPVDKDSQLQFKSSLTGMAWVNLGGIVTNRAENVCVVDSVDGPQKFYRVVFVP
jgi:hypothetical protein